MANREEVEADVVRLKELQVLELANRCKHDLFLLARDILGYELMTPSVHQELAYLLESLVWPASEYAGMIQEQTQYDDGDKDHRIFINRLDARELEKKFRLLLMPRGSFKSTETTISFTCQLLLISPDYRILIDSETFDKSRAFLSEIRGHLESNDKYRILYKALHGVYPDEQAKSEKWSDTELNVAGRRRRAKEPTISCSGVGVTKVGMHYDVILSDDLHSEKNVTTKDIIQSVIDHYKLNLSLLEPDGFMVVIGTRWDYLDTYQYIIDNELHRFCVYAQQAERPDGTLLFPERLTKEFLRDQKMSQGSSIYSMQYQNMPVDDDTATFKYSQMRRVDKDSIQGKPVNWFLMIDPAISQESTSDFTAFVVAGFDQFKNIYVKHIVKGKFTPSEIVDITFRLYQEFQPRCVGLETVAFQKTLQYSMNDKMREQGWWIPLKEIKRGAKSKEDRIKGLQPYYEYGHVFHLKSCPFLDDMEYELIHFPKGRNDDIIDALTDILEIGYPPSSRGSVDKETKDSKRRSLRKLNQPRSSFTRF